MAINIRRANEKDAKTVHDFEIALQKETHDLYKNSKFKEFAKLELRDIKKYTTKDYVKWLASTKNKTDVELTKIWYVAEESGKIVGDIYAEIRCDEGMLVKDRGYIDSLYILKNHRKKGYAKKLLAAILTWFKKKKIKHLYLNVDLINAPAEKLYKKFGFKPCKYEMHLEF
jgi:GNAT superfamily N-acetyltransferase